MEAKALLREFKVDLLSQLPQENKAFFKWFLALTELKRPSFECGPAMKTLAEWFAQMGVPSKSDEIGNTIFTIPASKGKENVPAIVVQGHLDIVSVGEFEDGKVKLKIENGHLTSGISTIGADDGFAVATMLAMAEEKDNFEHGEIECLVTVDEEVGLIGAQKMAGPPFLKSRAMINLDAEEWGVFISSCAGGMNIWYEHLCQRAEFEGRILNLKLKDLVSGHTGITIHEGRQNAVKWMVRLLLEAKRQGEEFRIVSISGGDKHNAIPGVCDCQVVVKTEKFEEILKETHEKINHEVKVIEVKHPKLSITPAEKGLLPLSQQDSDKVLNLLNTIHHGVWVYHPEIKGLVQTSQSMSVTKFEGENLRVQVFARTNEASMMEWLMNTNTAVAELAGVKISMPKDEMVWPWPAAMSSRITELSRQVYTELYGSEPQITGIHAGLECGAIQNRGYSDLEAIAFGPEIHGAHTVEENMSIDTANKCYVLALEVVKKWAQ